MSITQQFTVHTGTFITQKGERRNMSFIRMNDLPNSVTSVFTRSRNLQPGFETVYDVDLGKYRTFNYNSIVGNLSTSTRTVTIQS